MTGSGPCSVPGPVLAVVEDVEDPLGEGRIRVRFPHLGSDQLSGWAPVATPMAGADRGIWFKPEPGDEAVVLFERGDPSRPIVLGYLWNGVDHAPSTSVHERIIRSRNGHTIRFLDTDPSAPGGGAGQITVEDANGNSIVMTNGKITIRSLGVLEIDAAVIMLTSSGVTRIVTPNGNPI